LRVGVIQRAGGAGDDAEQQPGGVAHHPPGVHTLDPLCAQSLQPGYFGVQVVGVDVQVYPARAMAEPLDEQPGLLKLSFPATGQHGPSVFANIQFSLSGRIEV
jgi:hypothetical protein